MHRCSLFLAVLLAACSTTPSPASTARDSPVGSVPPSAGSPAPSASATFLTFADGEHRVGEDVQPGTYRAIPPAVGDGFCLWERVSGFGGTPAEIIATAAGAGPVVVTISPTDAGFVSDDCGTWTSDLSAPAGPIGDGVWIVGSDLQPGRYTSDGGGACVWQRLSGFGGTSDESLEVGLAGAVEIRPGDVGFSSSNCGTWVAAGG